MADTDKAVTAKRSTVLDDFFNEVKKGFISTRVSGIYGFTFDLALGDEDAEVWADQYIRPATPMAFVSARRTPRLATAIQAVGRDGNEPTKLIDLFQYPESMPAEQKKFMDENPVQKQYWLWNQMMVFLSRLPAPVVERLYKEYDDLSQRREKALAEAIENPNS